MLLDTLKSGLEIYKSIKHHFSNICDFLEPFELFTMFFMEFSQ